MISPGEIFNANILIVDDQNANVQLLEIMLHEAGYLNISTTTDPHEVSKLHSVNNYDLILLDLEMPGMNGFEVMANLQEINKNNPVPILVITAHQAQSVSALGAGAKDFISKPFALKETKIRIHNVLDSHLQYKKLETYSREQESLALHDALTGLSNRRLLKDRMNLAIAHGRRNNFSMGVLYIDLDGFKQVNDTYGHETGDALLSSVAKRLVEAVRGEDTVSRLSGDEFVIVLLDVNHDNDVSNLVSKLVKTIAEPYFIKGHKLKITASIGVALYPTHGTDVESLITSADQAMYAAKKAGKNGFRVAVRPDTLTTAKF
jgi:diguanylate cyclase (GGDEF)-like protein